MISKRRARRMLARQEMVWIDVAYIVMAVMFLGGAIIGFVVGRLTS